MPAVLLTPLALLLVGLVLLALTHSANTWAKALLRATAARHGGGLLGILTLPARLIAHVVLPALSYVSHKISAAATHYMHPVASWLGAMAHREALLQQARAALAGEVAHGIERGIDVVLPRQVQRGIDRLRHRLDRRLARLGGRLIALGVGLAALRRFAHGIDRLLHHRLIPGLRHAEHAVDVTLPRSIAREGHRIGALERELRHPSRAWVNRIARRAWAYPLAGLVTAYLFKRFRWLFCRNTTRGLKALCGLPSSIVDVLLGEALGLLLVVDICDTMRALETIGEAFEPELRFLVTATDDLIEHCGYDLPSASDRPGYGGGWIASAL